ncbi:hypothetical protein [Arthrobacter sp. VKM Ac-2550]|uniref:hypothetical protein n=1 Tax=Crystallibacter permensis TaxID=1938888 RepID=UPI0022269466|nr:hypothetical protein [Arthrobacter sp. VKM Ac-2550]MCW2132937.1 hypothetical protein [Arthrobacter sp. VKM Ac-2550]
MSRNFAEGFRVLADFIEANPIVGMAYPEQPLDVRVSVETLEALNEYAARFAAPVRENRDEDGTIYTTTFQFGPDNGVRLNVYHIELA